jgi:hypothetical protein
MMFAPFNGGLEGHEVMLKEAGLDKSKNEWFKVYDFTAESAIRGGGELHRHWSIMKKDQEDALWCPRGFSQNCIPRTDPNTMDDERNKSSDGESTQISKDPDDKRVIESKESVLISTVLFLTSTAATLRTSMNVLFGQMKSSSATLFSSGVNFVSFIVNCLTTTRKDQKTE